MQKQKIIKDDGRYLIYYAFDRPLPKVEVAAAAGGERGPGAESGGEPDSQAAGQKAAASGTSGDGGVR